MMYCLCVYVLSKITESYPKSLNQDVSCKICSILKILKAVFITVTVLLLAKIQAVKIISF